MTLEQYTNEINAKTAQKAKLLSEADALVTSGNAWISDGNKTMATCSKLLLKAKEEACKIEAQRKIDLGKGYLSQADSKKAQAAALQTEIDALIKNRDQAVVTADKVSATLAEQGKTQEGILTESQGKAQAEVTASTLEAQAKADAIALDSATANDGKKKMIYVGVAVAVVILLVVGFILYKKFKKK